MAVKLLDPLDEKNRLDRYELIGEIAAGGMAVVYLARNAGAGGFQRFVAIKRLHPHLAQEQEFVEMFLDEARLAAGIHNPHVVPILEVGESDNGYYLVMEYIEGDTLARVAARAAGRATGLHPTALGAGGKGPGAPPNRAKNAPPSMPSAGPAVPRNVTVRILLDCLAGLHAAHELTDAHGRPLQIVHRDVSPQNLLVGVDGSARITDFGVARAAARLSTTRSDTVKGKLAYLSPEQARGETADRRTDLFAMGIILWEMLTGRRLFRGETDHETLARVMSGNIAPPSTLVPGMHPAFDAVTLRALDRNMDRRFATCADMGDALERAALDAAKAGSEGGVASDRDVAAFMNNVLGQEIAAQRESVRVWLSQRNDPSLASLRPTPMRQSTLATGVQSIVAALPAPPRPVGLTPSITPQPFASMVSVPHPEDGDPTTLRVVSGLASGAPAARESGSELPARRSRGRIAAVVGVAALLAVGLAVLLKAGGPPDGSPVTAAPSGADSVPPPTSAALPASAGAAPTASATATPSEEPAASAAPTADASAAPTADAPDSPKSNGKWRPPSSSRAPATASAAAAAPPAKPPAKPASTGDDLSNPYK